MSKLQPALTSVPVVQQILRYTSKRPEDLIHYSKVCEAWSDTVKNYPGDIYRNFLHDDVYLTDTPKELFFTNPFARKEEFFLLEAKNYSDNDCLSLPKDHYDKKVGVIPTGGEDLFDCLRRFSRIGIFGTEGRGASLAEREEKLRKFRKDALCFMIDLGNSTLIEFLEKEYKSIDPDPTHKLWQEVLTAQEHKGIYILTLPGDEHPGMMKALITQYLKLSDKSHLNDAIQKRVLGSRHLSVAAYLNNFRAVQSNVELLRQVDIGKRELLKIIPEAIEQAGCNLEIVNYLTRVFIELDNEAHEGLAQLLSDTNYLFKASFRGNLELVKFWITIYLNHENGSLLRQHLQGALNLASQHFKNNNMALIKILTDQFFKFGDGEALFRAALSHGRHAILRGSESAGFEVTHFFVLQYLKLDSGVDFLNEALSTYDARDFFASCVRAMALQHQKHKSSALDEAVKIGYHHAFQQSTIQCHDERGEKLSLANIEYLTMLYIQLEEGTKFLIEALRLNDHKALHKADEERKTPYFRDRNPELLKFLFVLYKVVGILNELAIPLSKEAQEIRQEVDCGQHIITTLSKLVSPNILDAMQAVIDNIKDGSNVFEREAKVNPLTTIKDRYQNSLSRDDIKTFIEILGRGRQKQKDSSFFSCCYLEDKSYLLNLFNSKLSYFSTYYLTVNEQEKTPKYAPERTLEVSGYVDAPRM